MKPIEKLTKRERLALYKKALKCYLREKFPSGLDHSGLCMLLPCLYWDLKDYLDSRPDTREAWTYESTPFWFPEIKEWMEIYNTIDSGEERYESRMDYLRRIIEEMSPKKPQSKIFDKI